MATPSAPAINVVPAASSQDGPTKVVSRDSTVQDSKDGDEEPSDIWAPVRKPIRLSSAIRTRSIASGSTNATLAANRTSQEAVLQQARNIPPGSLRFKAMRLVRGRIFTLIVASAIFINVIFLGIETDLADPDDSNLGVWYYIEVGFTIGFCIELAIRIFADRRFFFQDRWNIFDLLLVVSSCIDNVIVEHISRGNNSQATDVVVVMRVLRVARVARVVRLLRFFKKLWLLIIGVVDAMRTLVWALVLITIVIFIFGMFMARALGQTHGSEDEYINELFGNLPKSMFTLFQVMTLEGWPTIVRTAIKVEPWIWCIFLLFLMLTTFSIMNVIVAVIVESTLEQADDHKSDALKRHEVELREAGEKITKVFNASDADGDGQITKEEFMNALQRQDVHAYLQDVGIDVRQAENLFEILDYDDSGSLDAQEFTSGVLKARGGALAKDILAVQCELWRYEMQLRRQLQRMCRGIDNRVAVVNAEIDVIHSELDGLRGSLGIAAAEADQPGQTMDSGPDMEIKDPQLMFQMSSFPDDEDLGDSSVEEILDEGPDRLMTMSGSMKRVRASIDKPW